MVSVPERFYQNFDSEFPSLSTLADPTLDGSLLFAKAGLANLVRYTAMESAQRIEAISIPPSLGVPATLLFDGFNSYMAGVAALDSPTIPDVLIDTAENFSAVASAMGAFDSVPIVGMILDFALTAINGAIAAYKFKHDEAIEAMAFGYDRDRDETFVRSSLTIHGGTDLTSLFLPVNDASDGISILNTAIDDSRIVKKTARALYIPRGPGTSNMGGLPNTRVIPKGMELDYANNPRTRPGGVPWSYFMPALSQANVASWQSVLSNSRACYLVDAVRLAAEWKTWQDNMQMWGWGTRYSGRDRIRMSMLSRPPVSYAQSERIKADGFSRIVSYWPGSGMKSSGDTGHTPHYGPLLGDVGAWAAEVQLGRRQRKYLGTLTVAYCSETDAAFASDPWLRDLLIERRRMLLAHADAVHVDLSQVVDADYRAALATRQGPKGITDAPGKPTPDIGGPLLGAPLRPTHSDMPPVLVAKVGAAAPFLPTTSGARGSGMRNAALLALFSFLAR